MWEDLKLNKKKTPLNTPPLELHPLSHIRLQIRGKTAVLPLRRCRVVREGVEDPVAHRNIILSIKRKYLHSFRHNGVGLEICTDHPANPSFHTRPSEGSLIEVEREEVSRQKERQDSGTSGRVGKLAFHSVAL